MYKGTEEKDLESPFLSEPFIPWRADQKRQSENKQSNLGRWTITCKQRGECGTWCDYRYIHVRCVCGMEGIPARRKPQDHTYNQLQSQNILFREERVTQNRTQCAHLQERERLAYQPTCLGWGTTDPTHTEVPARSYCLLVPLSHTHSPGLVPHHGCKAFIIAINWLPLSHTYLGKEGGPKHQELLSLLASVLTATGLHHIAQIHMHQQTFTWETLGNVKAQNVCIRVTVYALIRFHYRILNQKLGSGLTVSLAQLFLLLNQVWLTLVGSRVIPDCPGGGAPDDPLGRQRNTVRTAALFPAQGSMAIGLGAPWKRKPRVSLHRWDSMADFCCVSSVPQSVSTPGCWVIPNAGTVWIWA